MPQLDMGFVVLVFFVAILVTVMARASRFAPADLESVSRSRQAPPAPVSGVQPPIPLRRRAIGVAEHRYRMERLSRSRNHGTTVSVPRNQPEPRDITPPALRYVLLTGFQQEHARWLMGQGKSANYIYSVFGGNREKRLAELKAIRAELDAEQLAKVLAKPDVQVPAMEPVPI